MTRIRKKLGADVITTIRGLGYSLEDLRRLNEAAPDREATGEAVKVRERRGGSLTRRMIVVAAIWISLLLLIGGYGLDRVLARGIVQNFDQQLEYVLNAMIAASEIGPDGEVRFTRPPADQRFLEPYSGAYFQISGKGQETFPSRSLWDRRLRVDAALTMMSSCTSATASNSKASRCGSSNAT